MRQTICALLIIALGAACQGQVSVSKVEPPNWWAGLKHSTVQLMVYGADLHGVTVRSSSAHLKVGRIRPAQSPAYAFVDVEIAQRTPPGTYRLTFSKGGARATIDFPILKREPARGRYQGFTPEDVLYLITPDRFANGNTLNDSVPGMRDGFRPSALIGRHGGDIRGIRQHLDYIEDLGVSGIWINPLVENNTEVSYHGYAATDLYKIDPRFGTNEEYRQLVEDAHARGLKVVLDHVSNHISIYHPWIAALPSTDWLNGSVEKHEQTRHFKAAIPDIHADTATRRNVTDGWFTGYMPDLNQRNPLLAAYLIQNTLWWIEYAGLDGIREDTYPYADQAFLRSWVKAVRTEYPALSIVGEVWINDPAFLSPYQSGSVLSKLDSRLPSVTDFGLFEAFMKVFGDDRADIDVLYKMLAKDFLYPHPEHLVTFLDNHDVARIMYVCHDDTARFKMAMTLLLTLRGIPVIYYGTEMDMVGGTDHGEVRGEFPGGFPWHTRSAFAEAGRTEEERSMHGFVKRLLAIRKKHPALSQGTLTHIPPRENVYAYVREFSGEKVAVVVNNGSASRELPLEWLISRLGHSGAWKDLATGRALYSSSGQSVMLDANSVLVIGIGQPPR